MGLPEDVLAYLEDLDLVGDSGGFVGAVGYLPPEPDRVLAIFETPGVPPELEKDGSDALSYDEPGFQVRIRGDRFGYAAARERLGRVFRALHGASLPPAASGEPATLLIVSVNSAPLPLGLDATSRPGLTWNFRALRERDTSP